MILRGCVGSYWDMMDESDREQLGAVFRAYTIASFVAIFNRPIGEFSILHMRAAQGGYNVVDTAIGEARLSFVTWPTADGSLIVDVLVDGTISRVAAQRADFRSTLMHGGGPALLAGLERKVSDLSGGTLG